MKTKNLSICFALATSLIAGPVFAKKLQLEYGFTQNGKMSDEALQNLREDVRRAKNPNNLSEERYEEIVRDPSKAKTDGEKLAGLSAREIFILVDRSGSMMHSDKNPTGGSSVDWTRWKSAEKAGESIIELALSLDPTGEVDVTLWDSSKTEPLRTVDAVVRNVRDLEVLFSNNTPQNGNTPLAEALQHVYEKKWKALLEAKPAEPFTAVILTDGMPNDLNKVERFFKDLIKTHRLEDEGRETLAGFSFVRMGDDENAKKFLESLDDDLIKKLNVKVDIVDTKSDNFLFGTDEYANARANNVPHGAFALFYDAIYD